MNGQTERQDLESVRQSDGVRCHFALPVPSPPPSPPFSFIFELWPSDNAATLVNPIEIMYFVEEEGERGGPTVERQWSRE